MKGYSQTAGYELEALLYIRDILVGLYRRRKLILSCVVVSLLMGIFFIVLTPPRYTATASILIDPRQKVLMPNMLMQMMNFRENLILDSQIEVIRSTKLLQKAAEQAGIYDNLDSGEKGALASFVDQLTEAGGRDEVLEKERLRQEAFRAFRAGLSVARYEQTYVLNVSYTSQDREVAAERANLIADAYLQDEMETQYESSQQVNAWLKEWAAKLRDDLNLIEKQIENYKAEKNILEATPALSMADKELSELNSKLIASRAEVAQAKARYENISATIEKGGPAMMAGNLMSNQVLSDLHRKYVELSRHALEIKTRQGEDHKAYQNLTRQMQNIQTLIKDEYKRIAQGYKNEYDIALSKQKALEEELGQAKDATLVVRRDQIELRELQRRANSIQNLYTTLLDNLNRQLERQMAPFVQGRVISYAETPFYPSWPDKKLVMLYALGMGIFVGVGLALVREQFDKYIWRAEDIETAIDRTCLGLLPKTELDKADLRDKKGDASSFNDDVFAGITRTLDQQTGVASEIMRNIQLAIQSGPAHTDGSGIAVSLVSAGPAEGKSMTSCFLAKHLTNAGLSVALVDCDFRRPTLTNLLLPGAQNGFYELISQQTGQTDTSASASSGIEAICHETGTEQLCFVPAKGSETSIANPNLVASGPMKAIIARLKQKFDAVVIDLPPIVNIVDARIVADSIDSFIFLAQWGKTDRYVAEKSLERAPEVYDKIVGALLTQVDTKEAGRYGYYNYYYSYGR